MKKRINFYEKEATEYGVSEAIFLNYIREQVLLWTERQTRYIVKKLIDQKVIKTTKKNNQNFNQTIW